MTNPTPAPKPKSRWKSRFMIGSSILGFILFPLGVPILPVMTPASVLFIYTFWKQCLSKGIDEAVRSYDPDEDL